MAALCYTSQVTETQRSRDILERAAKLIFKSGFEATSMQQIAEACGLTKAGLYHHVKTKEAILVAIMHYGMDLFEDLEDPTPTGGRRPRTDRRRGTLDRGHSAITPSSRPGHRPGSSPSP